MTKPSRWSLRAGVLCALVTTACVFALPAQAEPYIYPPIYDPTRPIKDLVANPIPPDPLDAVQDAVPSGLTATCHFSGGTIEGLAVAEGVADTTGIACRVYDQSGIHRGGCGLGVSGSVAACAAPTQVVLGPPRVCVSAYATYPWGIDREEYCF